METKLIKKDFIEEEALLGLYEIHSNGLLYSLESQKYLVNSASTKTVQMSVTLKGKTYRFNYLNMMEKYFSDEVKFLSYEKPKLNLDVCYYKLDRKVDNKDYSLNNLYWRIKDSAIVVYDLEGNYLNKYPHKEIFFRDLDPLMSRNKTTLSNYISRNQCATSSLSFQIRNIKDGPATQLLDSIGPVWNISNFNIQVPVAKYFKGKLIAVYKSITEASKKNNIVKTQIHRNLNIREVNGFVFKTIE